MKKHIETAPAGEMIIQNVVPGAQVNHLMGQSQGIPAHRDMHRPRILERRAARWARRIAYA
jgi:hypothetical protein